jgi:uncharacterized membrane protein YfcA
MSEVFGWIVSERVYEFIHAGFVLSGRPFDGASYLVVAGICVIYFISFMGRGALGFGAIAPAVTLSSFLIAPHHAVLLAVVTAIVPQLQILPDGIRHGDWQVARPAIPALLLSIPIGVWLFTLISSDAFSLVLGAGISMIVILDTLKLLDRAARRVNIRKPTTVFGLSAVTGLIAGLAGAGGIMMLAVYLKHACRDYISLRATAALIGTLLIFWRLVATVVGGLIDLQLITEGALLVPIVYAGVWTGSHYFRNMGAERYYTLFQILLLISAVGLMVDGIVHLL